MKLQMCYLQVSQLGVLVKTPGGKFSIWLPGKPLQNIAHIHWAYKKKLIK